MEVNRDPLVTGDLVQVIDQELKQQKFTSPTEVDRFEMKWVEFAECWEQKLKPIYLEQSLRFGTAE